MLLDIQSLLLHYQLELSCRIADGTTTIVGPDGEFYTADGQIDEKHYTGIIDVFDGGGPGQSGLSYQGGGFYSDAANTITGGVGVEDTYVDELSGVDTVTTDTFAPGSSIVGTDYSEHNQTSGYTSLTDLVDGGGAGRPGPDFNNSISPIISETANLIIGSTRIRRRC